MREKRILMYRWKAYNYTDIIETFKKKGYVVDEIYQRLFSYDHDAGFEDKFLKMLDDHDYEFVFTVNYFGMISNMCQDRGLPYISWTCDNPLISMYHNSVYNDVNTIFTFDKTNFYEFREMGLKHIYYLPLAVDTSRISNMLSTSKDNFLYENEVAFVGGLYERNTYDKLESKLPDYLRGYFDGIMRVQSDLYGSSIVEDALTPEILKEIESIFDLKKTPESFSDLGLIFSTTVLGFKIARMERMDSLLRLSKKLPVSIYSNSDTEELIGVTYKGGVNYWTEMPKVFHGSKLNLNFTIPNIKSGIPLRVWDVLGSGGFLLTNFQAENPMYFKEGEDLVSFYSREDFLEKALFYYEHDAERCRIAAHGFETVEKYHNYDIRMGEMMDVVRKIIE
ncbi:MAG: DUF3880 domain-containing protein [Lachnospiraceae bacterium]|nr:DUF3880 domain-containing protein [Lachnospiraceae bacterium]